MKGVIVLNSVLFAFFILILYAIAHYIAKIRTSKQFTKGIIQLLEQSHTGRIKSLDWTFRVDEQVKHDLIYPLSLEQVIQIRQCKDPLEKSFVYQIAKFEMSQQIAVAKVNVSIDFDDPLSQTRIHLSNIPITIHCRLVSKEGWVVWKVCHS